MAFQLGAMNIFELGQMVIGKLKECGVKKPSELTIRVGKEEFGKIDEDLYYRNRNKDKGEFIPSEGEIVINFDNLRIVIEETEN